jgi:hypothetical protein
MTLEIILRDFWGYILRVCLSLCELFGIESCAVFGIMALPSEQRDSDLASFRDGA